MLTSIVANAGLSFSVSLPQVASVASVAQVSETIATVASIVADARLSGSNGNDEGKYNLKFFLKISSKFD